MEERLIEEEVAKRVEELVEKRVQEELERRKDDIEKEVSVPMYIIRSYLV